MVYFILTGSISVQYTVTALDGRAKGILQMFAPLGLYLSYQLELIGY